MFSDITWRNEYDSLMRLQTAADGSLSGIYRSHTGASGDYRVLGVVEPLTPETDSRGHAVALSISWRAIGATDNEASSHWSSGLCGQILPTPQGQRILLLHNLVASTKDASGIATGFYLDKLSYESKAESASAMRTPTFPQIADEASNRLNGTWICLEDFSLHLQLIVDKRGEIRGALSDGSDNRQRVVGLTDSRASVTGVRLQSVTISMLSERSAWSLSGWLDHGRNELHILQLRSSVTTFGERYLQTRSQSLRFKKA